MPARKYRGRWIVDFRFKGKRVRKNSPVDTKRGATEYERQLRERLLNGESLDGSPTAGEDEGKEVPTLKAFVEDEFMPNYVKANNKPSEQIAKRCIFRTQLYGAFGSKRLDEIKLRDIERFKATLLGKKKLSASRVNNCLTVLGRTLRYAQEIEVIESVPRIKFVKCPPADFDFFDFDELETLVAGATHPEERAAVLCAAEAGLRAGEVRVLQWRDIDFDRELLSVRRTEYQGHVGSPKGGRLRRVPMTDRLKATLEEAKHKRGLLIFGYKDGRAWTRGAQDWVLKRLCKKVGLRWIGWHGLRHTFCSHLAMRGAPARAIQELAGHADLTTTQRYMHLSPAAARDAIRLLGPTPRGHYVGTDRVPGEESA